MNMRMMAMALALGLAACSSTKDLQDVPVPLGDFAFGHNVVVANNMVKGPLSREATEEEWVGALTTAIGDRFDRYEGDRLYHFGVSVQGYVLAQPGVPVVASPKSVLIVNLDVWDDAKGQRLNTETKQITVLERMSGETFLGSGLTQSKEQQIKNLSENAARLIKNYLEQQQREEGWFVPETSSSAGIESVSPETAETEAAEGENTVDPAAEGQSAAQRSQDNAAEVGQSATDA